MSGVKTLFPKIVVRGVILCNFRRGLSASECLEEMKAGMGSEAPSKRSIYEWYAKFRTGHFELTDAPREGRPKTATDDRNVNAVAALIAEDPSVTYRVIEETLGLDAMSLHRILHDHLGLSKKSARWVPRDLSDAEKQKRVEFAQRFLAEFDGGSSNKFSRLVTGDETWIHFYDPLLKSQSEEWSVVGARNPTKVRRQRSADKFMVAIFFNRSGIVSVIEVPEGCTVTAEWYATECLDKVFQKLNDGRPGASLRRWSLHHDNASSHTAHVTMDVIATWEVNLVQPAPYSPDLSPCDFFLFPIVKKRMRGIRFESREQAREALDVELAKLEKRDFEVCFDAWISRLRKCIDVGGNYVEVS